eukprot:c8156_g1_i1.p1 GENE.c8156_g1_i1~~c8156_g1_i1.p1  ORF type:complete len:266 (-),score=39.43 c8156_g1_i1:53-787(-)
MHNISHDNSIHDPRLSDLGLSQAADAAKEEIVQSFLSSNSLLFVTSPLTRTLQTSIKIIETFGRNIPIVAHHDVQEIQTQPANTGRPVGELKLEFSSIDFSLVPDKWYIKPSPWVNNRVNEKGIVALNDRIKRFAAWLAQRPETHIIVVSHHGYICHALGVELFNAEALAVFLDPSTNTYDVQESNFGPVVPFTVKNVAHTYKGSQPLRASAKTVGLLHPEDGDPDSDVSSNKEFSSKRCCVCQ